MPDAPTDPDSTLDPARASDRWAPTGIAGALRTRLTRRPDERGSFTELWRASWTAELATDERFVQANLSRSLAGVLRGLHVHRRQADLWLVVSGRVFVAMVDLRDAVAGSGEPHTASMELGPDEAVYLPPLVAHGFHALADLELVYLVTNEFDGSDEYGFRWDDPEAAVPWPPGQPILSERDASAPDLTAVLQDLRQAEEPPPA